MGSIQLNANEIENLEEFIAENQLKTLPTTSKYEKIRIKDENIHMVLYNTGKLVFNDSEEISSIFNSILVTETDYEYYIGSDETGKGEWYGPLVVVAAALKPDEILKLRIMGVKDSKTLKTPKIIELARKILDLNIPHQSLVLAPSTYNKLYKNFQKEGKNLNDLLAWGHSRVIQDLTNKIEFKDAMVVIDKFDQKKTDYRLAKLDKSGIKVVQKTKGESEIPVAAASIIAKYLFEREIERLNNKYGLDLKKSSPENIEGQILGDVAKKHFTNVKKSLG
ncbi:MAG TPA: ribonuclease HIII [Methanobacterium sp.]|nr:ribonuclease HIII [Methanobacterium sp.]